MFRRICRGCAAAAATFSRLHTPSGGALPGYADGWIEFTQNGERIALHDGSDGVYYALMVVLPDRGKAAVAITNSGDIHGAEAATDTVQRLLGITINPANYQPGVSSCRAG